MQAEAGRGYPRANGCASWQTGHLLSVSVIHVKSDAKIRVQQMVVAMIRSLDSYFPVQTGSAETPKATSANIKISDAIDNTSASSTRGDSQTISTLAQQLAVSANLAEKRDKTLTRSQLADKAKIALSQIQGDAYFANKTRFDREVPKTNDVELLARARQATAYINSTAEGKNSEANPFSGLSRDQLANIVYDDSGTYTVNERRAASYEADRQDEAWRVRITNQAMNEYNNTGKLTNFYKSVLDYFKELPAIEQAQYPAGYANGLQSKIDLNLSYRV